jgi:hypothetical protein
LQNLNDWTCPLSGNRLEFEMSDGNSQIVHEKSKAVRELIGIVFFALGIVARRDYRRRRYPPFIFEIAQRVARQLLKTHFMRNDY